MASISDIATRIKSVNETAQITKAMELISVAKRRKAQVKYENNRAYSERVRSIIKDILDHMQTVKHPYLADRGGQRVGFIVIASDKGLAGDYNHKVLRLAWQEMNKTHSRHVFSIGQMAREFFAKRGLTPDVDFLHCAQNPTLDDARQIAADILYLYDSGMLDEVNIIYTESSSAFVSRPVMIRLLPISVDDFATARTDSNYKSTLSFEPDPKAVFDILVPQYIIGTIYSSLIQSVAAEHNERMRAMNSATTNAEEIVDGLSLELNRIRQERITTAIAELSARRE